MDIQKSIRIAMAQNGINQKELSELSGISENTISKALLGKSMPSTKTLNSLAEAMNMDYFEFISLGR